MKPIVILLTVGFIYIIVHEWTGFSIPCPIYTVTGLLCPGCGISRAIFHLLHFRFYEALSSNVVVVCLMPSFVLGAAVHLYRYIRYGNGAWVPVYVESYLLDTPDGGAITITMSYQVTHKQYFHQDFINAILSLSFI